MKDESGMTKDIRDKIFKECPDCHKKTRVWRVQNDIIFQECKPCDTNWKIKFSIEEM